MKMATKKLTEQDFENAEKQIKKLQIPYDYDTKEYPLEVLLYKFDSTDTEKSTIVIPAYQRDDIWKDDMKSEFIESLLLGVPIQPLFAAILDENGTLELIDGSQRLRTIEAFTKDEFRLSGLEKLTSLNGLFYSDFSPARKNKFGLISLRLHVITELADITVRQDIFKRINTTGVKANAPEVRKGSFTGKFYGFIIECAKNELFQKLCPISEDAKKRGGAEELILRFFTYADYGLERKEKGRRLLDNYVIEQNRKVIEKVKNGFDPNKKRKDFEKMLDFVNKYFDLGFKRAETSKFTPRVRFESISLGVYFALKEEPNLQPVYMEWLDSLQFKEVTTSDSSNNTGRLSARVNFVKDCLLNKIKKDDLTYEKS